MKSNISIVIPNWNGEEKIKKHLPNVINAARFSNVYEIIVVDDGSTDNSVEVIRKLFPEIKLIIKEKNSGFSSTVNRGFQAAKADFVMLLNNDASPAKNFIAPIMPHFTDKKVFSVGCNVGGLWAVGEFKDGYFWHNQGQKLGDEKIGSHLTLWASGGSAMFRKNIWDEMGGLDELMDPFYWEDVDLGYRALKRGYLNIWEPRSKVEHYKEPGVISLYFKKSTVISTAERNQLIFIWKNITDEDMVSAHRFALLKRLLIHPKYWRVFLAAAIKFSKISQKREIEQKYAKLTDRQIIEMFRVA